MGFLREEEIMIERPKEQAQKPFWSVRMELCKYLNMGIHNRDFLFLFFLQVSDGSESDFSAIFCC